MVNPKIEGVVFLTLVMAFNNANALGNVVEANKALPACKAVYVEASCSTHLDVKLTECEDNMFDEMEGALTSMGKRVETEILDKRTLNEMEDTVTYIDNALSGIDDRENPFLKKIQSCKNVAFISFEKCNEETQKGNPPEDLTYTVCEPEEIFSPSP